MASRMRTSGGLGRVADLAAQGQGLLARLAGAGQVAQLEEQARDVLEIDRSAPGRSPSSRSMA